MLQKILPIIQDAGAKMLSFDRPQVYEKEGHGNFVTEADIQVQAFLLDALSAAFPEALYFAEEQENPELTDGPTFVIDPIDGTTNFMRGRKCSSISVALLIRKEPVAGAILNPYANELFYSEKGRGAFLNGKEIHVSNEPFHRALVSMGTSPYQASLAEKSMQLAKTFLLQAVDLRRTGSAAIDLCDVACGRCDVFWELQLSPWDFAAGSLIVKEAGGLVGCPGQGPLPFHHKSALLAANPLCYRPSEDIITSQN